MCDSKKGVLLGSPTIHMETHDVQIRATDFQGKPLHIIKSIDGADYRFVRAAEWAIWGSDT